MQFIISVALHDCPLICATKEKQTMMVTVLYQIRKSSITLFKKLWTPFRRICTHPLGWIFQKNPRCLKFIENVIWMQKGQLLTKLHIYFLFRFLNYDFITLIIFKYKFSIFQLQQTN